MPRAKQAVVRKIARLMRDLDFCMFTTRTSRGQFRGRPMSNNREVEFDGDVWFFSAADSRKVREIQTHPVVHLSYIDLEAWRFLSMTGRAKIVRTVKKKQDLWQKELERWFDGGPESAAIVLIKVKPTLMSYWTKTDQEEITVR